MRKLALYTFIMILLPTICCAQIIKSPTILRKAPEANNGKIFKAAQNTDKNIDMYACILAGGKRCLAHFMSEQPYNLDRLKDFTPDEDIQIAEVNGVRCGVFHNGKYYASMASIYTFDEMPKALITIDLANGEYQIVRDMSDNIGEYAYWYEMTYDYEADKCYALGVRDEAQGVSSLYEVDLDNGTFTFLRDLDYYYLTLDCTYEGQLYGIRFKADKTGQQSIGSYLCKINKFTGLSEEPIELKENGQAFAPNGAQTMAFDHTTGNLWWLGLNTNGYQYLMKVNTVSGELTNKGTFGYASQGVGLYIPFASADSRLAPSCVTNLTATPATNGILKATLKWNNPTTRWNGSELTELQDVVIYRDGLQVDVVTCVDMMGQQMTWTDENPTYGMHEYKLVPRRDSDENGIPETIKCFIGKDKPGAAENIVATKNSETSITLTWEKPSAGENGGWYDENKLSYNIVRKPDNKVVASGLTTNVFRDDNLGEMESYYYEITSVDQELGEGAIGTSNSNLAGSAIAIPFTCYFETADDANRWTVIDANGGGKTWRYMGGNQEWTKRMVLGQTLNLKSDDWLITPRLRLEAGKTYKVISCIEAEQIKEQQDFHITLGKDATVEAQKTIIGNHENYVTQQYNAPDTFTDIFTVDETADYNIGVYCFSDGPAGLASGFYLLSMEVREVFAKDLAIEKIECPKEGVKGKESKMAVTIKNEGSEDQNSYIVNVFAISEDMTETKLATCTDVKPVTTGESVSLDVPFIPTSAGKAMIFAQVELEGDGASYNNKSDLQQMTIKGEGTMEWNLVVNDESKAFQQYAFPLNLDYDYNGLQTLCFKEEMGTKELEIHRIGLEYTEGYETDPIPAKVYLCNTDKNAFESKTDWMPTNGMQCAFNGEIKFENGSGILSFNFDKPFTYDPTKNLCIQIWTDKGAYMNGAKVNDGWPAFFYLFNESYSAPYTFVRYAAGAPFSLDNSSKMTALGFRVKMNMAVKETGLDNVKEIYIGRNSIEYCSSTNTINSCENIVGLQVYNTMGKLIASKNTNATSVRIESLPNGMYIARVATISGKIHNIKFVVK